jgi:hypothetical protein
MKNEWGNMPVMKTLSILSMIQQFLLTLNWARLYVCCTTCIQWNIHIHTRVQTTGDR